MSTNQLETDLREWSPRRPSAKVKQRIFGSTPAESHHAMPAWSWLAPVGACLFMAVALFNSQRDSLPPAGRLQNSMTLAASNQSSTVISPNTFEWTNEAILTSSMRSPLSLGTNH